MKTENKYQPCPLDTSDIHLPEELLPLMEAVAKNVHETWASNRMAEGWRYGEQRDDVRKYHPCLVPYEELSEEERHYDRATALATLKQIIKLGFKIENITK